MRSRRRPEVVFRVALAALVAAACDRRAPAPAPDAAGASATARDADGGPADAGSRDAAPDVGADADAAAALDPGDYVQSAPVRGRAVGNTSVVFKLELASGKKIAFKPDSRRGPRRYKGEIAAYRLARHLGLGQVPPAYFRTFTPAALRGALSAEGAALFDREVVPTSAGKVRGSAVPWIDGLRFAALEREPERSAWRGWLAKGGAIPDGKRARAREIAVLVAFDVLVGNWDRWSGGNVGETEGGSLLFIDNDGAFMHPFPAGPFAEARAVLAKTDRFSRGFVASVRALDAASLRAATGDEEPGEPLLSGAQIEGCLGRAAELLRHVDARVAALGEAEALYFE
jgi:hypothetical protein